MTITTKESYFNTLPDEILVNIFSYLGLPDLLRVAQVDTSCNRVTKEMKINEWINQYAFGAEKWEQYFNVTIENAPLIPQEVRAKLLENDPEDPNKKVFQTFSRLFLVPDKVTFKGNGVSLPVTIDNIPKIRGGGLSELNYDFYSDRVRSQIGKKEVFSHWILMKDKVIDESREKCSEDRKRILEETTYVLPDVVDVIVRDIIYYATKKERQYREENETYIWCREVIAMNGTNYQTLAGGWSRSVLNVYVSDIYIFNDALSACWKF